MKFSEVKRESYTIDELCLFLKFHLRIASATTLSIAIIQLIITSQYNLQFHPFYGMIYMMTEIAQILLGIAGLIYSFSYISKLQKLNCQYYENQNDNLSRVLFILSSIILGLVITLAIINPILFKIGMQSKISQIEYTSYDDMIRLQTAIQESSNIVLQAIMSGAETVSLIFVVYVFQLFSKNATTYNYFIYCFALITNIVLIFIFESQDDLLSLQKVNYVTIFNNQFLVTFISKASLFLSLVIITIFAFDTLAQYYQTFKNPIYKFILGNIIIGFAFALVGSNGQLIRNLSAYQENYLDKNQCRNYMNIIPNQVLENLGCLAKYHNLTERFPSCSQDEQTLVWEEKDQKYGCVNWNCCNLISQVLLKDYISYCILTSLASVLLMMIATMLFQIRLVQENAIGQTFKLIALLLSISILFGGLIAAHSIPDIEIYRKIYVEPQNYIPVNNMNQLKSQIKLNSVDWLPDKCSQHIPQKIIQEIIDSSSSLLELIITIDNGQFLINNINQENLFLYQSSTETQDSIYIKGKFTVAISIIQNNVQVCMFAANAQVNWSSKSFQINRHQQIQIRPSQVQQQTLNQLVKYIDINLINLNSSYKISLYQSLLFNCQIENINVYQEIININVNSITFYNYPIGQYATIVISNEQFQSCVYVQSFQNIYINPVIPIQKDISISLQWFGEGDLDLIVENQICKVGKKYQNLCATIQTENDSIIGNQQITKNVQSGEQITIEYLSEYNYLIYVEIALTQQEYQRLKDKTNSVNLYQQSNAQVQIFSKESHNPQANVFVKQIILEQNDSNQNKQFQLKWFVACIKNGSQLNIINKIGVEVEC